MRVKKEVRITKDVLAAILREYYGFPADVTVHWAARSSSVVVSWEDEEVLGPPVEKK